MHHLRRRFDALARQLAGEHLVKDDTEGVNVRPVVHGSGIIDLFRRHVIGSANHLAGLCHGGGTRLGALSCPGGFSENLRNAEIRNLHATAPVQDDVFRLDIPVHDALVMRVLQRIADLRNDRQRLPGRNPARLKELPQRDSVHKLHDQVKHVLGLAEIVNGHNVWVREFRKRFRLQHESLRKCLILLSLRRKDFQGDHAIERLLKGLVNDPHAASAETFQQLKVGKESGDVLQPGRRRLRDSSVFLLDRLGRHVHGHQAAGTKAGRRIRRKRLFALWTDRCVIAHAVCLTVSRRMLHILTLYSGINEPCRARAVARYLISSLRSAPGGSVCRISSR